MKYSRRCQCRRGCPHWVRGIEALQPAERLLELESVLTTLIDCAAAYDSDSLQYDPGCGIHGERSVSNVECTCRGEPTSATEFILTLQTEVKAAHAQGRPAGQPNRRRDGVMRLVASG